MSAVSEKSKRIDGMSLGTISYQFLQLLSLEASNRAILITPSDATAEALFKDLQFMKSFRRAELSEWDISLLGGWEQSPYRNLQPSVSQRIERLRCLQRLSKPEGRVIFVCSYESFLQKAPSREFLNESFLLKKGQRINPDLLEKKLVRLGYQRSDSVEDGGTFSQRGGIFDLFSIGEDHPVRIEFFDDEIETVRIFNPETQRSIRILSQEESLEIVPAREFRCDEESLFLAREPLKNWCDQRDLPKSARDRFSLLLNQGIAIPEMDYLFPIFSSGSSDLIDLSPAPIQLFLIEPERIFESLNEWEKKQEELFRFSIQKQQMILDPELLYSSFSQTTASKKVPSILEIRELALGESPQKFERIQFSQTNQHAQIDQLCNKIKTLIHLKSKTVLVANSQSQLDRLKFLLSQHKIPSIQISNESDLPKDPTVVALVNGTISESFFFADEKICFISEDQIFGAKKHFSKTKKKPTFTASNMNELVTGDLIVHSDHGIGKYLGLSQMKALGNEGDFALIEYSDGDKLYVPVYRLETLARYIGSPDSPGALDKLGSGSFQKTKEKVKTAVKDIAQDLLRVQAERNSKKGFSFSPPNEEFRNFEAEFPFDETPDQAKAIEDTLDDMTLCRPMDRLICGDVGFGKTEVAIRAAFKSAQDGKQVAVLVPTTILAEQHYISFSQRMLNYPVKVACISRFKSKKEQQEILKEVSEGKIDILIGTHRILSKDVIFKDLGLIIIDEEQRFGVEHKEKLKKMKATTDVLTLTATPIPRTLQMSLMGLKDVSIIRTPPGDRLSIKTHLATFDMDLIASAIRNERTRGGQTFMIHNRVQTIDKLGAAIQKAIPEIKIAIAHGQMAETQLEKAMIGFYRKEFDLLLATAIIENGLDVPNANTLIVDRADTFGLSQLYQIRGRVGRSQTRAYAYFLLPENASITDEARERLSVLQRFVDLGSGHTIATHDLEIRGGGDVLGQAQSGHIASVGYEMYLELLQSEVLRLKGVEISSPLQDVEINVPFTASLPSSYVADMKSRLVFYRKLSAITSEEETLSAESELKDRYGALPKEAEELLWVIRLKVLMRRMGLRTLTLGPKGISLTPGKDPMLSPPMILALVHNYPNEYSILPEGKFVVRGQFRTGSQVFEKLRQIFSQSTQ
jgi:transcription-repair coupling factor (superfamily II helicase)